MISYSFWADVAISSKADDVQLEERLWNKAAYIRNQDSWVGTIMRSSRAVSPPGGLARLTFFVSSTSTKLVFVAKYDRSDH